MLNHIWGKGRKLEIHVNNYLYTMLVRVPNDFFIRRKILEKRIWYVGDSMFYATQWATYHSTHTPAFNFIPIWAHLRGVPFDLRSLEGLGWIAGAIGEQNRQMISLKISSAS